MQTRSPTEVRQRCDLVESSVRPIWAARELQRSALTTQGPLTANILSPEVPVGHLSFIRLAEERERLAISRAALAAELSTLKALEVERDALVQELADLSNQASATGRYATLETELAESVRASASALEAAEDESELVIEAQQDQELRRLRARLGYCEELLRHGHESQRQMILHFTSKVRDRFIALQEEYLRGYRMDFLLLQHELKLLRSSRAHIQKQIKAKQESLDELNHRCAKITDAIGDLTERYQQQEKLIQDQEVAVATTQLAIQSVVERREIKFLIHFTPVQNIPSILKYGILPRAVLQAQNISAMCPDGMRLDQCLDRISLSISFPNYRMLYSKSMAPNAPAFCICKISPRVLWERHCLFSSRNAALSGQRHIAANEDWTASALEAMFVEPDLSIRGAKSRKDRLLPDSFPTNPQAEVLVAGSIPEEWIDTIVVSPSMPRDLLSTRFGWEAGIFKKVDAQRNLFAPRVDWEFYRSDF
jgi:hypothetical protein